MMEDDFITIHTVVFSHPLPLAKSLRGEKFNLLGEKLPPCLDPPVDRSLKSSPYSFDLFVLSV